MFERELPSWAELQHKNILPFYGTRISRTLPPNSPHGCVGVVTDIGRRLHMVSGLLYLRKREFDSTSFVDVAMAGEWKPAGLRKEQPSIR